MLLNFLLVNIKMNSIYFYITLFIIWLLYLELNPSLGNIWLRPDENNNLVINIGFLFTEPLRNLLLWNYNFIDLNVYIIILCIYIIKKLKF
jgi:hypothetical protein